MSLKPEYPLEVKVAKALGWTDFIQDKDEGFWWGTPPPSKTIPDPRPCPVPDYPNDPGEAIKAMLEFTDDLFFVERKEDMAICWLNGKPNNSEEEDEKVRIAHAICLAIVEAAGEGK